MEMMWLLVILAPYGAQPVMAFRTEAECNRAVVEISYQYAPAQIGGTMVCVEEFNKKRNANG